MTLSLIFKLRAKTSPAKVARMHGELALTDELADRLVRLPLWLGLEEQQERVIDLFQAHLSGGAM